MRHISLDMLATPGCQVCRVFEDYWKTIEGKWPNVAFKRVDLLSPEGQEMVKKYMIMASPGIVLNGDLFQVGGFDREKFVAKLKDLSQE